MTRTGRLQLAAVALTVAAAFACASPRPLPVATDPIDDGPYVFDVGNGRSRALGVRAGARIEEEIAPGAAVQVPGFVLDGAEDLEVPLTPRSPEPAKYEGIGRILAVSDVHGEYEPFVRLLRACGVLDASLHWSFGAGHLVLVGDVMDKGSKVTECLWLLYRLEDEARRAGGRVHLLLGNHEVGALGGRRDYLVPKYLQVEAILGREFEELFGGNTVLGAWLRARNTIVEIDGILFVHGGLDREVVERGFDLDEINRRIRSGIDQAPLLRAWVPKNRFLFGPRGPLWYRGYLRAKPGSPRAGDRDVASILDHFGARAVVVGHTTVPHIQVAYGKRVIAINVPLEAGAPGEALLVEDGAFYRLGVDGSAEPLAARFSGIRTATTSPRTQTTPCAESVIDVITLRGVASVTRPRISSSGPSGVGLR